MRKTRTARRRPSLATAISLAALVIAMSGSAYAATGGTFILGKANKATTVTSLSNSRGTALALTSGHGKPGLTINGVPSTDFLSGQAFSGTLNEGGFKQINIAGGSATLLMSCQQDGISTNPVGQWTITANINGERVGWLDKDGSDFSVFNSGDAQGLGGTSSDANSYTTVVQVWGAGGSGNVTAYVSVAVNDSAQLCIYGAQIVSGP